MPDSVITTVAPVALAIDPVEVAIVASPLTTSAFAATVSAVILTVLVPEPFAAVTPLIQALLIAAAIWFEIPASVF